MIQPVLISGPDVWMESEATRQLAAVAQLEGCIHAAGMPDLHPGRGFPIGAVVATREVVHPHLVGGDAGCGARVVVTSVERTSPDRLERRLRAAFETDLFEAVDPGTLFEAVWQTGVRALTELDGIPDDLRRLAAREPASDGLPPSAAGAPYRLGFERSLGTIGGGNHFAEIARVGRVLDCEAGDSIGLARDALVVLAHSGSRGLGAALAATWTTRILRGEDRDRYLGELAGACRFARTNRLVSCGGHQDNLGTGCLAHLDDNAPDLAGELGTHLLVQRSATRDRASRKRWFAAVSFHASPADEPHADITTIPRDALVITACRAGGPGGQHVNKVASAVRVHHVPSGIAIRSAGARSQKANLDQALRRLVVLLRERALARRAAGVASRRAAHYQLERGRAVRSYHLDDDGVLVERSPSA